jgi:hypothetical protein
MVLEQQSHALPRLVLAIYKIERVLFLHMKKLTLALGLLLFPTSAFPLESLFIGGQFGQVLLTGGAKTSFTDSLGFGVDLGFRTNPVLDLTLRSQLSSHTGGSGLSLWSNTLSADYLVGNFYDIEVFVGGGPGLYQFASTPSTLLFGLHAELYGDLIVSDSFKIGLGGRFHGILNNSATTGSYWTIMMRAGCTFGLGQ